MAKLNFYNLPDNEKSIVFQQIANAKNMSPFAVEKDWWVVQTLGIIFDMKVSAHIIFKGGTSFSKAWRLIERFSEDIDFAIDRDFFGFEGELNKAQRRDLRKASSLAISNPRFKLRLAVDPLESHLLSSPFPQWWTKRILIVILHKRLFQFQL